MHPLILFLLLLPVTVTTPLQAADSETYDGFNFSLGWTGGGSSDYGVEVDLVSPSLTKNDYAGHPQTLHLFLGWQGFVHKNIVTSDNGLFENRASQRVGLGLVSSFQLLGNGTFGTYTKAGASYLIPNEELSNESSISTTKKPRVV